jgi:4-aminobutyrate aminotransferase/(S)-3-amino-2-methylpropionate transaminase
MALAGGWPLAGVTGRADILTAPLVGGRGGTYGGNPLACVAALAVLDAMKQEDIVARGARVGAILRDRFSRWAAADSRIGDVRGLGAMMAIELVTEGTSREPDKDRTARVLAEALKRGLILLSAGTYGNVVRVLVPLTIEEAVLEEGLAVMEQALGAAG